MYKIYLFLLLIFIPVNVAAQSPVSDNDSESPIEISADNSLEWLQNKKQYIANGNVIVTQDDLELKADKLVAHYDDSKAGGASNITLLEATGNVALKDASNKAYGDSITYDLVTDDIVLTGSNPRLIAPDQTITATEKLTYNNKKGTARAIGNARIKTSTETLEAQTITAQFQKNTDGSSRQKLSTATTTGRLKITTDDEVITGSKGTYDAIKNTATVTGNVKIIRGPNTLEGERATVNLNTNISQIFGNEKSGKRVKGVFYPKSK